MALERPRIKVQEKAAVGDVVEIRAYISHVMETGLRRDPKSGQPVPRSIINSCSAQFNGIEFFRLQLHPGMAANPFVQFTLRVPGSGELEVSFVEDGGATVTESAKIDVD